MANLTKRTNPLNAYVYLGICSVGVALLASACSDGSSGSDTTGGAAGTATSGGAGGVGNGGSAGSTSSGGVKNTAGSAGNGGLGGGAGSSMGGSGGGGVGGGGGSTNGGMSGGGGTGGMACAPTDKCCDDPNKTDPGVCGCGVPDIDDDNDGVLSCKDKCPFDANKTEAGMCGCGVPENDSDGDGIIDCKPGYFVEAEDGVLSHEDVPVTPIDTGAGGAGGAGGADAGVGGAGAELPEMWTIGDDAKASKGKYLESPAGFTSDGLPGPARATYSVDLPVAKKYVFWGRFYTPSRDHNRLWVKVDDGVWLKLRVTTGETWFWYTFHKEGEFDMPIVFDLAKGKHTFAIASDSDGVKVDRFYVTAGGDRPPGDDTLCNPPHTIQVGNVCQSSCGMLQGNSCDPVMCAGKPALPAYDCAVCCTL